ncbi:MAG: cobalt transporter [Alphaproteobacteria bacterium]|nr:cobalt transporter [Alphaproteobacteria bacterium]
MAPIVSPRCWRPRCSARSCSWRSASCPSTRCTTPPTTPGTYSPSPVIDWAVAALLPRLLWVAVLAGIAGGVVATTLYGFWAAPLILEAETFEVVAEDHDHGWAPEDGWQRALATGLANTLLGFGAALTMAAWFTLSRTGGWRLGLWYGAAAFAALHLAPSLGLPPELPGAAAAPLIARQSWWLLTAAATLGAIVIAVKVPTWRWRLAAVALAVLPHVVGAPEPKEHATAVPAELRGAFIGASLVVSLVFWLVVGAASGYLGAWFGLGGGQRRLAPPAPSETPVAG